MKGFMNDLRVRRIAILLAVSMAFVSLVPRVEAAFVTSDESSSSTIRHKDMTTVKRILEHKIVKERLKALGYTEEEVKARLDKLSDGELHKFATQLDALAPGGDALGVIIALLIIVALVLVIFMLVDKRVVVQ